MLWILTLTACVAITVARASHSDCRTIHSTAFQNAQGPVPFTTSPLDSFEASKVPVLNDTAWEGWYFDSVSTSGLSGITIAFLRDPTFSILGEGNLYIFLYAARVIDCGGSISGLWNSSNSAYSFHVPKDLKGATFTIDTPIVTGTYQIFASVSPRYADGSTYPTASAPTSLNPNDYWTEGIPAGSVTANFTINTIPFHLSGFGGHGRHYGTMPLDRIIKYWTFSRAIVGPYAFVLWRVVTKPDNKVRVSGVLTRNGQVQFATMSMESSEDVPYLVFEPSHDGSTRGSFEDQSTGFSLDFISPREGSHWRFSIKHAHLAYEMPFIGGDGFGGFVDMADGGLLGGEMYSGVALTQQNQMASEGLTRLLRWDSLVFIGQMGYKVLSGQLKKALTIRSFSLARPEL